MTIKSLISDLRDRINTAMNAMKAQEKEFPKNQPLQITTLSSQMAANVGTEVLDIVEELDKKVESYKRPDVDIWFHDSTPEAAKLDMMIVKNPTVLPNVDDTIDSPIGLRRVTKRYFDYRPNGNCRVHIYLGKVMKDE